MKTNLLTLLALTFSFAVFANDPSTSSQQFCEDRTDSHFIKDLILDSRNLLTFRNHGGIGNGGVCWWHSRFQRNALYLTIYKPHLKKPTIEEARKIIVQIRDAKGVVIIPGYKNLSEFSFDQSLLIQAELEKWQKGDGILRLAWIKGLSGNAEVSSAKMKAIMDRMYDDVEIKNNISFNKLQIKGITAHAWLVVSMEKVNGGYNLEILDSNIANRTEIYRYRDGDTSFNYHGYFIFTPYLEQTKEMVSLKNTVNKFCNSNELIANNN
jgi:hypothetical protein